ncbi:hypothetical protein [Fibrella forsythiae]|uniref:Uncharacterized protein n=1 Tax=Fibrella forsythiae TaxID=2817061 RepID=A0ABS3JT00_9BACT|nr:hypothetical protein [Fibrella forsythiae]MBO0953125.1 hypothetical protein [Fibrella forsythiae]
MNRTNVVRAAQNATPPPPSGNSSRLTQIRAYQQLAKVRLRERLTGTATSATLYDLLMRDQLTFIKLNSHA